MTSIDLLEVHNNPLLQPQFCEIFCLLFVPDPDTAKNNGFQATPKLKGIQDHAEGCVITFLDPINREYSIGPIDILMARLCMDQDMEVNDILDLSKTY